MKDLKYLYIGISTKQKIVSKDSNDQNPTIFYVDASFQGVKRLFVLTFHNIDNGNKKVEKTATGNIFFQEWIQPITMY